MKVIGQIGGPPKKPGDQFWASVSQAAVNPSKYKVVARVGRDIGVTPGVEFGIAQMFEIPGFNTLGQNNPASLFELREYLKGKVIGSEIKFSLGVPPAPGTHITNFVTQMDHPWVSNGGFGFSLNRGKEFFNIDAKYVGSTKFLSDTKKGDAFDDIEVTVTWGIKYDMPPATGPNEINIGFQNLWMRPDWVALGCVATRVPMIANLIAPSSNPAQNTYDVLSFVEAFNQDAAQLFDILSKRGYPYQTGVLAKDKINPSDVLASVSKELKVLNGGVAIVSKYPIEKKASVLFTDCADDDCKAWKGAWYIKIIKQGKPFHIFNTHTNASYDQPPTNDTVIARQKQLDQFKKFIEAQGIPKTDPVIISGDMNINMYNTTEYKDMLRRLNATHPSLRGYQGKNEVEKDNNFYTFNYTMNRLVNDASDYMNLALLDYVLYSNEYLKPIASFNEMRMYTVDKPYICAPASINLQLIQRLFTEVGKKQALEYVNSISDHWFIYGYFKFPTR
jgi:endonuclease/exonuclease/phosphatase family metal-dependent hydrolase